MQESNEVKVIEYDQGSKAEKQHQNANVTEKSIDQEEDSDNDTESSESESSSQDTEVEKLDLDKLGDEYEISSGPGSDNSDTESDVTDSTIDILKKDPLFQVMSEFFHSKNSQNICDILEKINVNLEKLILK